MAGPSYATLADLSTYGVSANALQTVPSANQQNALDAASEYVSSYLCGRFTLPLKTWGSDIRRAVAIVAAYDLMFVRGYNPADGPDSELGKRHDDVVSWLNRIANGTVVPEVQDSSALAATDPGGGGAFARQVNVDYGSSALSSQTLGGAPGKVTDSSGTGRVSVGSPRLRGW